MLTFHNLLKRINKADLKIHSNKKEALNYTMVTPIFKSSSLQDNTLYVAFVSDLDNLCINQSTVGFILIPDIPLKENIHISGEFVVWDKIVPLETLYNTVQIEFRRKVELASNMSSIFSALIKGNSLQELIDIGTKILGNPIIVTNSAYKVLAMSNIHIDEPFWQFAKTHGYCSQDSINCYKNEGINKKVLESDDPVLLNDGIWQENNIISNKLVIKNKILGYIEVHEMNKKFTPSDIDAVKIFSDILAVEIRTDIYEEAITHTVYEDIIIDLLNEVVPTTNTLLNRLCSANWSLKKYLILIRIPLFKSDQSISFLDYLYTKLVYRATVSKIARYHDSLVVIINYNKQTEYDMELNNITDILIGNNIKGGISRIFSKSEFENLSFYYHQASIAYDLGTLTNKASTFLYPYENVILFHLFSKIKDKNELKIFCHPSYNKLLKHDKLNGTEYCKSIYEYILCANNISAAADKLFIHRNTMAYRLNKISEITGLDLTNGINIYKLYFSQKINEWLKY
ncbi:GAF domain-containing protein [Clostridium sp. C2-6-12]|uniref:GAF domain-containing protein n=1 Tax=Clostridium sp. C2-6-12 TaxID=2698832 RepID=UPI00136DC678|nr:GAF domain-containing protein [Clostridium sp. C2-6-12]